ncbi:hypothetical protein [Sphingomonas sp. TDK1]|uniref:hypothetical protein n=1 Tax=Sphingomonas sp. TDK1 TaxID=453247 RepID=UPI0007D90423|nr:hypothetical protein [Sphingomonas sp. TDK1]OAN66415.1 hypothetical protein A7X12_13695 [Sphingomonas sp. TDK1]
MPRLPLISLLLALLVAALPAQAQQNAFDLVGPDLKLSVTRGGVTLPIGAVPSLQPGDKVTAEAALPPDQSAHYLLVVAFLRGATNPPPKDWFFVAETWRKKKNRMELEVPKGAEQAVLLLAPETGGGFDAVRDTVRGRPGVFVRAAQDLFQASLDRARLDAFVTAVGRIGESAPERLSTAAPVLANALRIKLNAECLSRPRSLQAACLTQNRDSLVLQAQRGTTLAETLTGAPVDLAYSLAATPQGGGGFYSPYIGLARDVAKLFGAFRSPQYQYLPALGLGRGDALKLLLNAAPSFQNPRSVLVVALPPLGAATPPIWQAGGPTPVCLAQPGLALPLEDAPLLYATDFARSLSIHVTSNDGKTRDFPVAPDVEKGGVRLDEAVPADLGTVSNAVLQGRWGFDGFSGPRLPVQLDAMGAWRAVPDSNVVVGREHPLVLRGGAAFCVSQIALSDAKGVRTPVPFKVSGQDELTMTLPLKDAKPGALTLNIARFGTAPPDMIPLVARLEASRLDRFVLHEGDRDGVLDGARLDQVTGLDWHGLHFTPADLSRGKDGDQLALKADAAIPAGDGEAVVRLRDGRTMKLSVRATAPRPAATLLSRAASGKAASGALALTLPEGVLPADAAIDFSFKMTRGTLRDDGIVEIAGTDGPNARLGFRDGALQRIGDAVVVAHFAPRALLGAGITGPLRYRLVQGEAAGDWQPLVTVARLPQLTGLACPAEGSSCTLSGTDLFLVAAIGDKPDLAGATAVPLGFVGGSLALPRPVGKTLYLRLHDAPDSVAQVTLPG